MIQIGENSDIISKCRFTHHRTHIEWPRIEIGPPRYQAGVTNIMSRDRGDRKVDTEFDYIK